MYCGRGVREPDIIIYNNIISQNKTVAIMKSYTAFWCGLLPELLILLTLRSVLSVDAAFNAGYVNHGDTKGKYIIINITAKSNNNNNQQPNIIHYKL